MVLYACFIPATSKYRHSDDMHAFFVSSGLKGEALSSTSDVSLLEIVTKTHGRPNGYRKVLKVKDCAADKEKLPEDILLLDPRVVIN
ncbi:hypothetical protein H5410_009651 [Solanum commersonii]|uniref:Uncharacterized protein n=1 Tax=Solanum commersonii TaxID=4109 RepID=A0A9J6AJ12_SOLCO|nr:hypothetical protein H5410_009651 [Solanum commersonii]